MVSSNNLRSMMGDMSQISMQSSAVERRDNCEVTATDISAHSSFMTIPECDYLVADPNQSNRTHLRPAGGVHHWPARDCDIRVPAIMAISTCRGIIACWILIRRRFACRDLGSLNGTFVNGDVVGRRPAADPGVALRPSEPRQLE